jgi:hypothetical protein
MDQIWTMESRRPGGHGLATARRARAYLRGALARAGGPRPAQPARWLLRTPSRRFSIARGLRPRCDLFPDKPCFHATTVSRPAPPWPATIRRSLAATACAPASSPPPAARASVLATPWPSPATAAPRWPCATTKPARLCRTLRRGSPTDREPARWRPGLLLGLGRRRSRPGGGVARRGRSAIRHPHRQSRCRQEHFGIFSFSSIQHSSRIGVSAMSPWTRSEKIGMAGALGTAFCAIAAFIGISLGRSQVPTPPTPVTTHLANASGERPAPGSIPPNPSGTPAPENSQRVVAGDDAVRPATPRQRADTFAGESVDPPQIRTRRPESPIEFTLQDGEQRAILDGQASVAFESNRVGEAEFATVVINVAGSEPIRKAVLGAGAHFDFSVHGRAYFLSVLRATSGAASIRIDPRR